MNMQKKTGRKGSAYVVKGKRFDCLSDAAAAFHVTPRTIWGWARTRKDCWTEPRDGHRAELPKKENSVIYESAADYLAAVVRGSEESDTIRVRAAVALLPYEAPKTRPKAKSLTPKELHRKEARAEEDLILLDFQEKAKAIRKRHAERIAKEEEL